MAKAKHHRRSIRLPQHDYSTAGGYFITMCTRNRDCLFGNVVDGQMILNQYGQIVNDVWNNLPNHYPHVELDAYAIMPNHFHGIIMITIAIDANKNIAVGAGLKPAPTSIEINITSIKFHKLSEIVRAFKTFSSRGINQIRQTPGMPVWQRNYHEHVIRQGIELDEKRKYIRSNPLNWDTDSENIATVCGDKHATVGAGLPRPYNECQNT